MPIQNSFQKTFKSIKKTGQKSILIKIDTLINELRKHPMTGTGNPEALKGNLKGLWSRRITQKHRLIYEIREDHVKVILLTAQGHYKDK